MIDVLIVEDDPMVTELNKKYLQMITGFRLIGQASNGEQALQIITEQPVSLILLDLFMPKIDGLELLKRIRHHHPTIDIIMVTADRSAESIQSALRLGVIDYIVKPFTFDRLRTALNTYRERLRLLSSCNELDQTALDNRIFSKALIQDKTLPKGIDIETLNKVRSVITHYGQSFTVSDLLPFIDLSRISLKKYIDYLEESCELESYLSYPAIGRPARIYVAI